MVAMKSFMFVFVIRNKAETTAEMMNILKYDVPFKFFISVAPGLAIEKSSGTAFKGLMPTNSK